MELYPQFPKDLDHYSLQDVVVGEHKISLHWKRHEAGNHFVLTHVKGATDLEVTFRVAIEEKTPVEVNGKLVDVEIQALKGVMTKVVEVSLQPGTSTAFHF